MLKYKKQQKNNIVFAKNFCITIYLNKKLKRFLVVLKDFCKKIIIKKFCFNRNLIIYFNRKFANIIINFLNIIIANL